MGETLWEAFWLLVVGMGSAFFVLYLIGVSGRFLISRVNSLEEDKTILPESISAQGHSILPLHVAVITAAVEEATNGQGKIENIQKIEL
jgi:Na+-transporting methylmalonyl-CoA/oxaloacetate decarboxylase gamma subunit